MVSSELQVARHMLCITNFLGWANGQKVSDSNAELFDKIRAVPATG